MNIKNWIIHKLGGVVKEEVAEPVQYKIYYPEVIPLVAQYIDKYSCMPKEYVEEVLAHNLISVIKKYMKIEKETNYYGDSCYIARINIIKIKE